MTTTSKKQMANDLRKILSIELCDNFTTRLHPDQKREIKLGAIIAIKNLIKESNINDPILYSFLVDSITDPDQTVQSKVLKVIKEVINTEIAELLEIKLKELSGELKKEAKKLLRS